VSPEHDVFISYSRQNSRFVNRLVADLRDHQVKVWIDTLEIKVGDQFMHRIEDGIQKSKFFCFVISDASLKSFFIRRFELEAAFAKMAQERRSGFILPLRLNCKRKIPLQLSTYQYLNFSSHRLYMSNLKSLVNRILLTDELFTGNRLYKNVDTSMTGTMVGVGEPLKQPPYRGSYIRAFFEQGRIRSMETYSDGKPDGAKSVLYDEKGRVVEIMLFRNNKVIDSWRYEYSLKTGLRKYKWVCRPGEHAHQRLEYDRQGNKIREANVDSQGLVQNGNEGWAIKEYVRNANGNVTEYKYFTKNTRLIRTEKIT
jgi:antitoxin component YwqK of YwqJK toxin-antitoxin module